ncbi:high affinity copper uptake protein 1-like [Bradysia coprophila]|uniref:high affinity copper uptake protein 1-like n=1 Tax=Bradysia coprophila TaxID=38358 RepID=UPI00187DC475|nr:high affinity copper uptake protein 1-like [Bradysia coprophila]XP_037048270.1 high affinity copper uptake protein 1-like [Bradysia coprophila]XP_037048275.1 high affinity copper uptake protein 1-like [Bradysia coprophila]XP_037048282.1 high affinity copper uptake protein 1-like [Bradysia coprophila]XP_037048293.1 high affinity copper uptake protein 1-like [Bradysia coprophila]XP_037048304.1 high affinity copper uptake protein 1-like [Bradysia coprophila]XP_037048315.1 high affinity copper
MHHSMSFDWTTNVGDFFFKGLTINTAGSFTALCAVLIILSLTYELMKVHAAKVRARTARERLRSASCAPSETATLITSNSTTFGRQQFPQQLAKLSAEAAVFLLHNTLGYALMLSVMIYNGYLFITVVLSMGLGYFLFGHISMKVNMENMQARTTNVICAPICPEEPTSSSSSRPSGHCELTNETPTVLREIQGSSSCESNITDSCRL